MVICIRPWAASIPFDPLWPLWPLVAFWPHRPALTAVGVALILAAIIKAILIQSKHNLSDNLKKVL